MEVYGLGICVPKIIVTNLIFPDLSPVARACPSGLIRRHLTPALRVSPESRMFFMASEKRKKNQL